MDKKENKCRKGTKYDREDNQILAFMIFGILLIIVIRWMPIPAGYHWQDDIPARFGLSLGKFVFYSLLIEGLCFILVIVAVLNWRRNRNLNIDLVYACSQLIESIFLFLEYLDHEVQDSHLLRE